MNNRIRIIAALVFAAEISKMWIESNRPADGDKSDQTVFRASNRIIKRAEKILGNMQKVSRVEEIVLSQGFNKFYGKIGVENGKVFAYNRMITLAAAIFEAMPRRQDTDHLFGSINEIIQHYGNRYDLNDEYAQALVDLRAWDEVWI